MSKFKAAGFEIKKDDQKADTRVMKMAGSTQNVIQDFELPKLKNKSEPRDYSAVKAKFGSLASTDQEQDLKQQKDRRFKLSPLLRDPLAIEEEERRVIDEKVRTRISAISEEAREKASEAGYRDGLERGHQEAFEKFRKEGEERLRRFTTLIEEAEAAKEQIFHANERFLIELIFRVAKMVTLKDLSVDSDYLLRLTRDLIERLGVRENITVRIAEKDLETAGMLKEGLEQSLGALKNLNIQASPQVKGGGCVVESEWNAIDASVDTQLQGLYAALIGKQADGSDS